MNTGVLIVAIVFMAALVLVLGWYLLIYTEGVLLSKRIVIALYDLYAERHNKSSSSMILMSTSLLPSL